ncbi:MAG TPA: UPF0280 family protein [Anaerovoracaceae bacterium]|nr:UPF0280 family protein [Anaerovoracaceae bacterium]
MERTNAEYVTRYYRLWHEAKDLSYFNTVVKDSDLAIGVDIVNCTDSLMAFCHRQLQELRNELEEYIRLHPEFNSSLIPLELLPNAPPIAQQMAQAAVIAQVGPMAAVAGAFAQAIGEKISAQVKDVIVENGGDIYMNCSKDRIIGIFAGTSKFSNKIGIKVKKLESPVGICTSSGTVGHSLSFGTADAVVVKGMPVALADAVATGTGNLVKSEADLMKAIDYARNIAGVSGIMVIKNDKMAVWGEMEVLPVKERRENESGK